eukprot:4655426-Pleurochrysis_carterae.AAC.1
MLFMALALINKHNKCYGFKWSATTGWANGKAQYRKENVIQIVFSQSQGSSRKAKQGGGASM